MGGFDTFYHHELTERLAWRPAQAGELRLHGVRNLAYAVTFMALGWSEPHGAAALALIAVLIGEAVITLWDFVEEDRTRKLPASERITHTLLTLNYGVILAMLVPLAIEWAGLPTALALAYYWPWSWLCAVAAAGVTVSGLRDLAATRRTPRLVGAEPAVLAGPDGPPRCPGHWRHWLHRPPAGRGPGCRRPRCYGADASPSRGCRAAGAAGLVMSLDQLANDASIDAIVNLAGEPIADGLWTARKRDRILRSRLEMTASVVALVRHLKGRPRSW